MVTAATQQSAATRRDIQVSNERSRNRLIVVVGTNRSGTTWLSQLLRVHRDISGAEHESALFDGLAGLWRTALTWDDPMRSRLPAAELARHTRRFCDDLLDSAQRRSAHPSARYFVEKTPSNARFLPWIKIVYPDAWYVRITRDGRDVARSMRLRNYGTKSDLFNIQCWVRHEAMADAYLEGVDRVIEVRYEEMHADPLGETSKIYRTLDLAPYGGLARAMAKRSGTAIATYTSDSDVGPGKWRRDVSRRRLGLMYAAAGEALCRRGYLEEAELRRWSRRPEYWAALLRLRLVKSGVAHGRAVWLFTTGMQMLDSPDGGALEAWARIERDYMMHPKVTAPGIDVRGWHRSTVTRSVSKARPGW